MISALQLWKQLLDYDLVITRLIYEHNPPLTLTQMHALSELYNEQEVRVTELAKTLGVDKSSTSRLIDGMQTRGLVKKERAKTGDSRTKILRLTTRGAAKLDEDDRVRSTYTSLLVSKLSGDEQGDFLKFFRSLADNMGVSEVIRRPFESELRPQYRRLNIAFDLLGESLYGTGLSLTKIQILRATESLEEEVTLSTLADHIPIDISSLSRAIAGLVSDGLLKKRRASNDKRKYIIELTKNGCKISRSAEQRVAEVLGSALLSISEKVLSGGYKVLGALIDRWKLPKEDFAYELEKSYQLQYTLLSSSEKRGI